MEGWTLAATSRPERFVLRDEAWFQQALDSGLYVSDIQYLSSIDEMGLIIAAPILRAATGQPIWDDARPCGSQRNQQSTDTSGSGYSRRRTAALEQRGKTSSYGPGEERRSDSCTARCG